MKYKYILVSILIIIANSSAIQEWTYPGCDPLSENDFGYKKLVDIVENDHTLLEPIDMEFEVVNGRVNFWFIQRRGEIKYYDAEMDAVIPVNIWTYDIADFSYHQNHGLVGIEKDPDFETNRWMYIYYSSGRYEGPNTDNTPDQELGHFRISRFKVLSDHSMDLASEKVILSIPMINRKYIYHTGGDMEFDAYGNMWIGIGDNCYNMEFLSTTVLGSSSERAAANTKSLLGGVVRIKPIKFPDTESPEPGIGRTYTIPEKGDADGNLVDNYGKHFAEVYPERAAEFLDTDKVAPEVYAKGGRNPYTISLEPVKQWVTTGDCGPDPDNENLPTEEHHFLTEPEFMGWPYFSGPDVKTNNDNNIDPNIIINESPFNTGLKQLTPAKPPLHWYKRECAVTGPIYRYDGRIPSAEKMPPHFNNVWFPTDYNLSWVKAIKVDETGKSMVREDTVFTKHKFARPLLLTEGPDGAFYIINYAGSYSATPETSIGRIFYKGSCQDPQLIPPEPVSIHKAMLAARGLPYINIEVSGNDISVDTDEKYTFKVTDIKGKELSIKHMGENRYSLTDLAGGVYVLSAISGKHIVSRTITKF